MKGILTFVFDKHRYADEERVKEEAKKK